MITEEINNIKSGRHELRKFGITIGIVLLLVGGFAWWRGKDYYFYFLGTSELFLFLALVTPSVLKPINKIWMTLAILMSWVMTRVILCILFYLGITPIGLLARLFKKDILGIKFSNQTACSYWIPKEKLKESNCERQF
ncbi:MAG: hypothetical protein HW406_34 [Candidatus Brocadiaceae bacterium]|nr:hypothetical protein [Candidatus Brocadiaceae bacterium]